MYTERYQCQGNPRVAGWAMIAYHSPAVSR